MEDGCFSGSYSEIQIFECKQRSPFVGTAHDRHQLNPGSVKSKKGSRSLGTYIQSRSINRCRPNFHTLGPHFEPVRRLAVWIYGFTHEICVALITAQTVGPDSLGPSCKVMS